MSNIPIHPQLAENQLGMPWTLDEMIGLQNNCYLCTKDDWQLASINPHVFLMDGLNPQLVMNVMREAPNLLNAALWLKDSLVSPNSTPFNSRQYFEDLMATIARALGTTPKPEDIP